MKKFLPYLFILLVAGAVLLMVFTGKASSESRALDQRVTLRKTDKIPYGTWVAFRQLKDIFPQARVYTERNEPGSWDSLSTYDPHQTILIITHRFRASEFELKHLKKFAENGNDVFISAAEWSYDAENFFQCETVSMESATEIGSDTEADSLVLYLSPPPGGGTSRFVYPGKHLQGYFSKLDTTQAEVLGSDSRQRPNFVRLKAGNGHIYLHLAPSAFTNYFLLHRSNIAYYERALSYLDADTRRLLWDEYFLGKRDNASPPRENRGWFTALMHLRNADDRKPFMAAFWLLIGLAALYILLEMRRRQRLIPVLKSPANDSLEFVKTVGRLYYEKGDHRNLCLKMSQYFLEHVRLSYKLNTGKLDDTFVKNLQYKSGADPELVSDIVRFIRGLEEAGEVGQAQLLQFHRQLEYFYQHT